MIAHFIARIMTLHCLTIHVSLAKEGPLPRFLSVFLACGGLTPWFLNLSSVLYPPLPAPPAALPSPHPQLTHNLSPSHPSPPLPSPPTHSPPTASALEQLRPENEWVLPSHALLSDRDPCSAVCT